MAVTYVVGDTPLLEITASDANGRINLTGTTVVVRFSIDGADVKTGAMTITDAPNGLAQYRFLTTDLDQAGHLTYEIRITSGSSVFTSRTYHREVREPL